MGLYVLSDCIFCGLYCIFFVYFYWLRTWLGVNINNHTLYINQSKINMSISLISRDILTPLSIQYNGPYNPIIIHKYNGLKVDVDDEKMENVVVGHVFFIYFMKNITSSPTKHVQTKRSTLLLGCCFSRKC